ncbi:MAG TPA: hypothetical protein VHQ00_10760, partial [Chloroflexota bacterium]|nr:hypothetical protein [Chloroflexota bacterium]
MTKEFLRAPRRESSVRRVLARRRLWSVPGAGVLVVLLALALGLSVPPAILAAPPAQTGSGPSAGISYLHHQPGTGPFARPKVTAYVQVFDRADPPIGRAPVTGLAPTAFSATEDGRPVSLTVRPAAPDEPVALIVVADTNTGREWLPAGPRHADPLLYLRDAATRVLREFPQNGRYAVYTMAGGAAGTPPLGDRATAEAAAQQLQPAPDARLLERLEQAVEALRDAPPGWRRLIFVLSDGNSAFGRNYELVQGSAAQARVAVFAVGTPDSNNPFRFLERMGQETGGQAWIFEKAELQPSAASPVLLDILVDQAVKSIKSAYRLEYTPPSAREQRELGVSVRMASGEARSRLVSYRADPAPSVPQPLLFLGIGLPLLALAGGGLYYYWLRPVKTDYYLAGYGPSTGHVPELYLYTDWRPLGRGGRGYPLTPDDPFFAGISKTHVWLRVQNWRRIQGGSGQAQGVGAVEARAGRPSSGVGLNTTFVHNELTGLRALSEKPFRLQTGDVLILQSAAHT